MLHRNAVRVRAETARSLPDASHQTHWRAVRQVVAFLAFTIGAHTVPSHTTTMQLQELCWQWCGCSRCLRMRMKSKTSSDRSHAPAQWCRIRAMRTESQGNQTNFELRRCVRFVKKPIFHSCYWRVSVGLFCGQFIGGLIFHPISQDNDGISTCVCQILSGLRGGGDFCRRFTVKS